VLGRLTSVAFTACPLCPLQRDGALVYLRAYNRGDISTLEALRRAKLPWHSWREARVAWDTLVKTRRPDRVGFHGKVHDIEDEVGFAVRQVPFWPALPVAAWVARHCPGFDWNRVIYALDDASDFLYGWPGDYEGPWTSQLCQQLKKMEEWALAAEAQATQAQAAVRQAAEAPPAPSNVAWSGRLRERQLRPLGRYDSDEFCE
jgi:hypothetical protein